MSELAPRIHDDSNGFDYILVGDYYIPALVGDMPDISTIGRWGRMRLEFIKKNCPTLYHELKCSGIYPFQS
ncbi:MAG: TnpV protein [Clostridiales bacterium]|nr:TnpV protein [Clostridiales bacterium]